MALEKKYYVFAAKLECANNIKKKRNLALIEELTIEELNDIWPGWTHKDIVNNFLEIYKHIIKAEAKGIKRENAVVHKPYELVSQFRCDGSDGYISFLNNLLELKQTANTRFEFNKLEFKVYDNPNLLREELRKKNEINNKSRMIAGYCYDWNVKNKRGDWDIELSDGFKAKWNLEKDEHWAVNPNSFEEIGCIHTCQGMEFEYVGVFIGRDLYYENGLD